MLVRFWACEQFKVKLCLYRQTYSHSLVEGWSLSFVHFDLMVGPFRMLKWLCAATGMWKACGRIQVQELIPNISTMSSVWQTNIWKRKISKYFQIYQRFSSVLFYNTEDTISRLSLALISKLYLLVFTVEDYRSSTKKTPIAFGLSAKSRLCGRFLLHKKRNSTKTVISYHNLKWQSICSLLGYYSAVAWLMIECCYF